jgi:hypothetical protein
MAGAGLAGLIPAGVISEVLASCGSTNPSQGLFTEHQIAVLTEATARLIPGPIDDPAESGHPGAREADVTGYIVTLLGAMNYQPSKVFAGGPFSNRAGNSIDEMNVFIPPNPALSANWRARLARLHGVYLAGIAALDQAARKLGASDFAHLTGSSKDQVLATNPAVKHLPSGYDGFTDLLFEHAIEGMYSVPEYGGNKGLVGWKDIGFPGDVQPRGYTAAEVSSPIDTVPYTPTPPVAKVIQLLESTAPKSLPPAAPLPKTGG